VKRGQKHEVVTAVFLFYCASWSKPVCSYGLA